MRKSKSAYRHEWVKGAVRGKQVAPPQGVVVEAKRANALANADPLRYVFGEPLPGRSALDKMKKEGRVP